MPAQRTRASKQEAARELKRSPSMDSVSSQTIAFAPTVTPGTFFDPPSPQDPPHESMLFPPTADAASPSARRAGHAKKRPENHIPRPPNAFILFRSSFIKNQHVSSEVETNHSTLSKIIGLTWQNLPHEERQIWHTKAKVALDEHKRKFPQYAFRPLHSKGKPAEKRKVREVGPKDLKRCTKIAELLVEGKKGSELDAAIAEFDRHHVPEIVTRFETPITARSFRRSSSAPAPDSNAPFLASASAGKLRSMSSQPETSASTPDPTPGPSARTGSQSDYESSESDGSLCTTPVSPYPTTPFTETNPSFDFSTFSFSSAAPTPIPPAGGHHVSYPCLPPIQTQFDGFAFAPPQQPSPLSCSPLGSEHMYSSPGPLDVGFPYAELYDPFAAGTPGDAQQQQTIYSPLPLPHPAARVQPQLAQFEYAYDYAHDLPAYHPQQQPHADFCFAQQQQHQSYEGEPSYVPAYAM